MLQDQSRNRTPMPVAQPPAGGAPPEPGPARAEAGIAQLLSASPAHAPKPTERDLARLVVDYFGDGPMNEFLDGDIALRDCARAILATSPNNPDTARVEAGIARMLAAPADADPGHPDPILGVIEIWRERDAALSAFDAQVSAGTFAGNKVEEEDRLIESRAPVRDTVLATVPTTPDGRAALVQFVRAEIAASGTIDGGPPDDDHPIWRDGLRALLAAQEAELRAGAEAWHPGMGRAVHRQEASPDLVAMVEEWQALLEQLNGGGLNDADVEQLGVRHDELQREICDFPSASTADLLAKVPVFRDELYDATHGFSDGCEVKDTLSGAAWLGLFRDFEHLARTASPPATPSSARPEAAGPHPAPAAEVNADAALIALVDRFVVADRACDEADAALELIYHAKEAAEPPRPAALRRAGDFRHFWGGASNPESPEFYDADEVRRLRTMTETGHLHQRETDAALARAAEIGAAWDEWQAACNAIDAALGLHNAEARWDELDVDRKALLTGILAVRPTTLVGLAAKARVWNHEWQADMAAVFRADLMAMGEAEGRLRAEPSLSDRIIACWREWSTITDPDRTELEEREAREALGKRRYALIDAAEALPATIENLSAKALALAWVEYPAIWENGRARDDYAVDGRFALDIDTAICGRLATEA